MRRVVITLSLLGIFQTFILGCHHSIRQGGPGERCRKKSDCQAEHICWKGRCYIGQCLQSSDCPKGWIGCFYQIRKCARTVVHMQSMKWNLEYPFPKGFVLDRPMFVYDPKVRKNIHSPNSGNVQQAINTISATHHRKKVSSVRVVNRDI